MEVVIVDDLHTIGRLGARIIADQLADDPTSAIGLATGSSPQPVYARLIEMCAAGEVSFARASAATLDEYIGLPIDHPESYRNVIRRDLTTRIDLDEARLHTPTVDTDDVPAACRAYDELVTKANIAVQILGIGTDGHLAFNEPGSSLASRTRVKTLTEQTRLDNARFFASIDHVPRHVMTQGLGTIGDARHLVLIATGDGKASAIRDAIEGPVTAACPASIVQFHPHVTVLVDEGAASRLDRADYYRHTYAHKPSWQRL